jgi:hypothetical protein
MFSNRKLSWLLLLTFAAIAFLAFAYPIYVIRPFRAQGPRELALALAVRSWGPGIAIAAAAGALLVAAGLWKGSTPKLSKFAIAFTIVLTIGSAVLAHVNVYERMFHRIDEPAVIAAADAKLDNDDMVLAIQVDGVARAYPVRMMAYHHVANDLLGRVPIVSTY